MPPLCGNDVEVGVDKGGRVKNQSRPNPISGFIVPAIGVTISVDIPDVVGVIGVRGAKPPVCFAAVIIGDALSSGKTASVIFEV